MKALLKRSLKGLISGLASSLNTNSAGRYFRSQIVAGAMGRTRQIEHGDVRLLLSAPNALNDFRVDTFATKEPETLTWIDGIPEGSVLWDIGANVGLYTCYAAASRRCRVFAFEPSVFNLELLARNVYLNSLSDLVTIVPLPLSDALAVSKLNMTSTEWGGALSTFRESFGFDGRPMSSTFAFSTIGMSIEDARTLLGVPCPDYLKVDVDGIEHLILRGGAETLKRVKGVLIEINDDFKQQAEDSARYLSAAGLTLAERHSWAGSDDSPFESTFNQIWHRN